MFVRRPRSAVLLLASGARLGRRVPPMRRRRVPRREGHDRARRHGVYDAGCEQRAHLGRGAGGGQVPRIGRRMADAEPPARLPGVRRRRRLPPAGHDGDGRTHDAPLPRTQAHVREPVSRAVPQSRDEPLHHVLSVRAVLRDYAGGDDLAAFGSRDRMYFGRATDGVLENPFAGNLVEVCPTGVFTDKPASKSYTRKWDLQSAPSICTGCAVGCNTFPAERYGTLRRIHNRYHHDINGYFLCDRGRFGGGFVNSDARLRRAGSRIADGSFDVIDARSRDGQIRGAAAAGSGRWHRFAACVGRSELRAAHAGRRRQLQPRFWRRRRNPRCRRARVDARRARCEPDDCRSGTGRRRADPRRRRAQHRAARCARAAPGGAQSHVRDGARRADSVVAGRRCAQPRAAGEEPRLFGDADADAMRRLRDRDDSRGGRRARRARRCDRQCDRGRQRETGCRHRRSSSTERRRHCAVRSDR